MKLRFWSQSQNHVRICDPAKWRYDPPVPAKSHAKAHWPYAAMCAIAYARVGLRPNTPAPDKRSSTSAQGVGEGQLHGAGWKRWVGFPNEELASTLNQAGVYADVWERDEPTREIAVVFEGTKVLSLKDWRSNFRWFLRFVPSYQDHYTIAADEFCRAFYERLSTDETRYRIRIGEPSLGSPDGKTIELVAAGHSLGGGLAQHFAYAFQQPFLSGGPRVAEVFAFNSSPVTGWTVVPRGQRTYNAKGLRINRIFEHGEALAYLRLITSRLVKRNRVLSIYEYRYNFSRSWNIFKNHSMQPLANGLWQAAQGEAQPGSHEPDTQ